MPCVSFPIPKRAEQIGPLIVGAVGFVVYLRTLMPGIAFGDWGEMQTVPHVLGVAHPTGYPTYILIAWLAELVPIGTVAFRANALSALFVAATLATVTVIAGRLGVRPLVAAAAGLALGAIGTVWAAATVAEVNPLHLLLVALILHRALVWEELRRPADLAIGGLLVGLALGNHLLTLFVAPFVLLFVLWVGRAELNARPWLVLAAVGAAILGLSVYLYIPIAASLGPPLPYNHPTTLEGVWWLVSGTQFRGQFDFLGSRGPAEFIGSMAALWELVVSRATPIVPLLGVAGLALLVRRRPAFGLTAVAILFMAVYIWANYLHLEHYLLVSWLVLAVGGAVAVEWLAALAGRFIPSASTAAGAVVGGVAVAGAVVLIATTWTSADRSADRSGEDYVAAVFGALPADAVILSEWDSSTPLWHGQHVRGERPDVLIVDDTNIVYEGWVTREARIASVICDRPVFILRLSEGDLAPTRAAYRLTPFLPVQVAVGGPSAEIEREIYRVEPLPGTCSA
jgi:hypothetical protein